MKRQLKILEHALSSLWRRKGKSFAIVTVYAFTIGVIASVLFLTHALRTETDRLLAGVPDLIVQRQVAGRHELIDTGYAEQIGRLPGIASVSPRFWGYYYDSFTEANFTLMGVVPDEGEDWPLLAGRMAAAPDECVIGAGVARLREVGIGDELALIDSGNMGRFYVVTGIFSSDSQLLTNDLVLLTDAELRRFFGFPPTAATDLAVAVHNPREVDTLAGKIKRDLPDTRPITRSEIIRTYDAVFSWRSGMLLTVFVSALAAFCVLAWDKATGLSAEEKNEIGVLKAVGWDTADVLALKFWEGMAIALVAFLVGVAAALVHVFLLGAPVLASVIKGWSVLFPAFRLVPHIDLGQLFILAFLTVTPYVVSTVIPSWKAAITDPDRVMRM